MIERHWKGIAKSAEADRYVEHLIRDTFVGLKRLDGFRRATILRRSVAGGIEFLIVTTWESLESIKAFAGEDVNRAVVPEHVRHMMVDYDEYVLHYEVLENIASN